MFAPNSQLQRVCVCVCDVRVMNQYEERQKKTMVVRQYCTENIIWWAIQPVGLGATILHRKHPLMRHPACGTWCGNIAQKTSFFVNCWRTLNSLIELPFGWILVLGLREGIVIF